MVRTYEELSKLKTFEERFKYLELKGRVGKDTFGFDRYLNQVFYNSYEWRSIRNVVIIRDEGCDLGVHGHEIVSGPLMIHHINPITVEQVYDRDPEIFNPNFLITVSLQTHNAIHFGNEDYLNRFSFTERRPNDTKLW